MQRRRQSRGSKTSHPLNRTVGTSATARAKASEKQALRGLRQIPVEISGSHEVSRVGAARNALIRPDLKAAPAKIGGSNLKAVRRPLQRSRDSAMLALPGYPRWVTPPRLTGVSMSWFEILMLCGLVSLGCLYFAVAALSEEVGKIQRTTHQVSKSLDDLRRQVEELKE